MTAHELPGVICFEGDWDESLEGRASIEPALNLLERTDTIRLIHRNVATEDALKYYIDRWLGAEDREGLDGFDIAYFGFHGQAWEVMVGDTPVSLDTIADIIDGRGAGKYLIFSSCGVLNVDDPILRAFCRRTGAKGVIGYSKTVDWISSAAFEILLLDQLIWRTSVKPLYESMVQRHEYLAKELGFLVAHANGVFD